MNSPAIVLHHGLFGLSNLKLGPIQLTYFKGIAEALAARGYRVVIPRVHPTGSIERRANQLKVILRERLGDSPCVIIAHSMGGLDARHMITHLGLADRVVALVTISTPHRGSPYADWCLKHVGDRLGASHLFRMLRLDFSGIADLTREGCAQFNERTPDASGVRYYSISACRPWYQVPPWAMHSWRVIHVAEGANDGLVSVNSAKWGEHLETWRADHWHTINRRFVIERKAKRTGDVVPYYLRLVERVLSQSR